MNKMNITELTVHELLEKLRFLGFTPYYGTNNFGSNYIEVICR